VWQLLPSVGNINPQISLSRGVVSCLKLILFALTIITGPPTHSAAGPD